MVTEGIKCNLSALWVVSYSAIFLPFNISTIILSNQLSRCWLITSVPQVFEERPASNTCGVKITSLLMRKGEALPSRTFIHKWITLTKGLKFRLKSLQQRLLWIQRKNVTRKCFKIREKYSHIGEGDNTQRFRLGLDSSSNDKTVSVLLSDKESGSNRCIVPGLLWFDFTLSPYNAVLIFSWLRKAYILRTLTVPSTIHSEQVKTKFSNQLFDLNFYILDLFFFLMNAKYLNFQRSFLL